MQLFHIFARNCLKRFILKILGISSPKLGKNDLFTMTKHRICWYIGLYSWLNRVKFSFLDNSKHSKFCFRKKQFLAISRQFSSVNFENPCQTKIKQIWKRKHFNYSRVKDELKIKTYFQRQSRAKYIGNLLGSTENLDSKRTFSFAFCLFSTR